METPKIKSVEEQANYFRGAANIVRAKMMLREDRAALHTSLVAAVKRDNGMSFQNVMWHSETALLDIINSIFKE